MKDLVNKIKQRQEFRPFACYFRRGCSQTLYVERVFSPYMQYIVKAKDRECIQRRT